MSIVFGPFILGIFGPDYKSAHWPLVLFMVSQLFRAAGGMNQHLLSLEGYQMRSAGACVVAMALLAGAAFVLTPSLGLLGMAIAVIIAEAAWAAILGVQAQRHAGQRGDIFAGFPHPQGACRINLLLRREGCYIGAKSERSAAR